MHERHLCASLRLPDRSLPRAWNLDASLNAGSPVEWGTIQVLRYNTGSAIRPKNSRQDQIWDIIHGQEGDGEAQEALPRKQEENPSIVQGVSGFDR